MHEALRDVIARARRARLAQREFEALTPESLEALRHPAGRTRPIEKEQYDEDYDRIAEITGQPTRWLAPRGSLR